MPIQHKSQVGHPCHRHGAQTQHVDKIIRLRTNRATDPLASSLSRKEPTVLDCLMCSWAN